MISLLILKAFVVVVVMASPWLVIQYIHQRRDNKRGNLIFQRASKGVGTGTGVHFVSGVPGGGKSLWVLQEWIVAELLYGKRIVVTNFAFGKNLVKMRQWMAERGIPDYRLQLLGDEEARQFYFRRFRVGRRSGLCVPYRFQNLSDADWKAGHLPKWQIKIGDVGILYVLEESANLFRAREYRDFPPSATFYLSQHRKCGDGIVILTQDVEWISIDMRRVAQDFTYLTNYAQAAFRGITVGKWFEARTFEYQVTRGVTKGVPVRVKLFRFDPEIANLYETAAGIGFKGTGADTSWIPKGVPLWVVAIAVFVGMYGVWFVFNRVSTSYAKKTFAAMTRQGEKAAAATLDAAKAGAPGLTPGTTATMPVFITGFSRTGQDASFFLSDGRQLSNPDGVFDGRKLILKSGEVLAMAGR